MAVISHALHGDGVSSTFRRKEGPEYTAHYRVITDDADDEADVIRDYVLANIATFGDTYSYANGSDTAAKLQSITPTRAADTWYVWTVALQYSPDASNPEENKDEDGNETDDPLEFRRTIALDRVEITKPVERATYLGGYLAETDVLLGGVGAQIIPMNSALVPFVPGLERPASLLQFTVTWNVALVAPRQLDAVNLSTLNVAFYNGFSWANVQPRTCKLNVHRVTWKSLNGVDYWEESLGFLWDRDTWVQEVCDRGIAARAREGDPDGRGGYISGGDTHWEREGVPRVRRIVDADDTPITEPVLLDGKGQPLTPDANGALVPVYGKWLTLPEIEFKNIDIFQGILQ